MHWLSKAVLWAVASMALLASLALAVLTLPRWGTPIARLLYETDFGDIVATELAKLPDSENACIFDDSQSIFVASPDQLNVGRMLRRALQDRTPRLNPVWRDPHFRVLTGGRTYYWSFRDRTFHGYYADQFTLAGTAERLCEYYLQSPQDFRDAFKLRDGINVSEANFCCGVDQGLPAALLDGAIDPRDHVVDL